MDLPYFETTSLNCVYNEINQSTSAKLFYKNVLYFVEVSRDNIT